MTKELIMFRLPLIEDAGHQVRLIWNLELRNEDEAREDDKFFHNLLKLLRDNKGDDELGMSYSPTSQATFRLDTRSRIVWASKHMKHYGGSKLPLGATWIISSATGWVILPSPHCTKRSLPNR